MSRSLEARKKRAKKNQQKFKLKKLQRKLNKKITREIDEDDLLIINVTEEDCNFDSE